MADLSQVKTGRQLIAAFLLDCPQFWDSITWNQEGDPIYPLHVCHAFSDWLVDQGVIDRERAEREKRILTACDNGS